MSFSVGPLPYIPPKEAELKEMTLQKKKEFYAMPLDVQLYWRQFDPRLGEPQLKKPDDELFWFSDEPCELVPSKNLMPSCGGWLDDFDEERSEEELKQWEEYLGSLAPETRSYIESIINQGEEGEEGRLEGEEGEEEGGGEDTAL